MFSDFYRQLKSGIEDDLRSVETKAEKGIYLAARKNELVAMLRRQAERLQAINLPEGIEQEGYSIARKNLESRFRLAISINQEFSDEPFLSRLETVISNPQLYTVDINLDTQTVRVLYNFEMVAGKIQDYAQAVDQARQILGLGKYGEKPSQKARSGNEASMIWKNLIYQPAREGTSIIKKRKRKGMKKAKDIDYTEGYVERYFRTMQTRFDSMETIAPFWEILNSGSGVMPASTGRRGAWPYPEAVATNFVEEAQAKSEAEIRAILSKIFESVKRLQQIIRDIRRAIDDINRLLEGTNLDEAIRRGIDEVARRYAPEVFNQFRDRLEQRLYEIALARQGRPTRIELGYVGGIRRRPRATTVYKIIDEMLGR